MRRTRTLVALLTALILILVAGSRLTASADSGVVVSEYTLGDTAFIDPGFDGANELTAVVHRPARMDGLLPLVVLSHGAWFWCEADAEGWPCPPGVEPFPSYRGYDYLGQALAARGFVVVSISVNGINTQPGGAYDSRAHLINRHLAMWQELASTGGGPLAGALADAAAFRGHVDMDRVGTMGHSRGGKAVTWQAADAHRAEVPAGVRIRAVVPLAPVKFDIVEDDPTEGLITDIPFAVVTGTCDGAVGERGREYFDEVEGKNTAPVYWVSLKGANHNFFNTEWVEKPGIPGEDDSTCPGASALPAQQQRAAALTYLTAFYERHLKDDVRADAILSGASPLPGVTAEAHVRPPAR
jgi:dienelactone hydrolase